VKQDINMTVITAYFLNNYSQKKF